jgi:hypothetical protein
LLQGGAMTEMDDGSSLKSRSLDGTFCDRRLGTTGGPERAPGKGRDVT